jgi:hypothetical protein
MVPTSRRQVLPRLRPSRRDMRSAVVQAAKWKAVSRLRTSGRDWCRTVVSAQLGVRGWLPASPGDGSWSALPVRCTARRDRSGCFSTGSLVPTPSRRRQIAERQVLTKTSCRTRCARLPSRRPTCRVRHPEDSPSHQIGEQERCPRLHGRPPRTRSRSKRSRGFVVAPQRWKNFGILEKIMPAC